MREKNRIFFKVCSERKKNKNGGRKSQHTAVRLSAQYAYTQKEKILKAKNRQKKKPSKMCFFTKLYRILHCWRNSHVHAHIDSHNLAALFEICSISARRNFGYADNINRNYSKSVNHSGQLWLIITGNQTRDDDLIANDEL